MLTNDRSYWTASNRSVTVDAGFRLHEGRTITGQLEWGAAASEGTRRAREAALLLTGAYQLNWRDYSTVGDGPCGRFGYVLVNVARHT